MRMLIFFLVPCQLAKPWLIDLPFFPLQYQMKLNSQIINTYNPMMRGSDSVGSHTMSAKTCKFSTFDMYASQKRLHHCKCRNQQMSFLCLLQPNLDQILREVPVAMFLDLKIGCMTQNATFITPIEQGVSPNLLGRYKSLESPGFTRSI